MLHQQFSTRSMTTCEHAYTDVSTLVVDNSSYLELDALNPIIYAQLPQQNSHNCNSICKSRHHRANGSENRNKNKKFGISNINNGFDIARMNETKTVLNLKEDENAIEETDSLVSLETVSDNVSVWVDGEKHWISGVDANTTCADLIWALLNYQDGQQNTNCPPITSDANNNKNGAFYGNNSKNNMIGTLEEDLDKIQTATAIHRGTEKEINKPIQVLEYILVKHHPQCEEFLDGSMKVFDVFPPTSDANIKQTRKECELLLRRLVNPPQTVTHVSSLLSTDKDSGMGSPIGSSRSAKFRRKKYSKSSPSWFTLGNTLHPKLTKTNNTVANDRLLKIILAQDQTIHRQLSLLREKEHQISCIEEEQHRVRERELGKNYLLETYLNGLETANSGINSDDDAEIFIANEPHQRLSTNLRIRDNEREFAHNRNADASKNGDETTSDALESKIKISRSTRKDASCADAIVDEVNANVNCVTEKLEVRHIKADEASNLKDIQLQIEWLEKVYAINKQLLSEEEILLKLYAKVRKHHVKRAYQTKKDVLYQIDKLDLELAFQYSDIHRVETNLGMSNEQLKKKLRVLERLSQEFLQVKKTTITASETNAPSSESIFDSEGINRNSKDIRVSQELSQDLVLGHQQNALGQEPKIPDIPRDIVSYEKLSSPLATKAQLLPKSTMLEQYHFDTQEDIIKIQQLIAKPIAPELVCEIDKASLAKTATTCDADSVNQFDHLTVSGNRDLLMDLSVSCGHLVENQAIADKNTLPLNIHKPKNVQKQMFAPKYSDRAAKLLSIQQYQKTSLVISQNQSDSLHQCPLEERLPQLLNHSDITKLGTLV